MKLRFLMLANDVFTISNFRMALVKKIVAKQDSVFLAAPKPQKIEWSKGQDELEVITGNRFYECRFSRSKLSIFELFYMVKSLKRILSESNANVLVTYTLKPLIAGLLVNALSVNKTILVVNITGLGYIFTTRGFMTNMIRLTILYTIKLLRYNVSLFIFQNKDDLRFFSTNGICDETNSIVVGGSGVDLDKFHPISAPKFDGSFVFVGRLLRDKGIYEFLEAAIVLKDNFPNAQFTVVGDFDDNPSSACPMEIEYLLNSSSAKHVKFTRDMVKIYQKNSVFVLPSYREGLPRSAIEALACGLPIITTDTPGCREVVTDEKNGFLVPVGSKDALYLAMKSFFNGANYTKMSAASRSRALTRFGENMVNDKIYSAIKNTFVNEISK